MWLQHSRSLDHSDLLLLTAMFTHPLLGIRAARPRLHAALRTATLRGGATKTPPPVLSVDVEVSQTSFRASEALPSLSCRQTDL